MELSREQAYALLTEYTKSDSLIKHALAVEAAMAAYARKFGEDEIKWRVVGLLHDFDYEQYPSAEQHPSTGARILEEMGYPEEVVYAVKSHGDHMGLPRNRLMEKALFSVDELSGFIIAVALVRPSKSLMDVDAKAVRKKMKDKAFARAVRREDITNGASELGVELDGHIEFVIGAMRAIAGDLGLK